MRARSSVVARLVLLAGIAALLMGGCNGVLGIHEPSVAVLDDAGDTGPSQLEPPAMSPDPGDAGADTRVDTDQDAGH